jgi:hypothetical protein
LTISAYKITVAYNEEKLKAEFDCPLCGANWEFPFPAQRIFGKPFPTPAQIVILHLYGTGSEVRYCHGFDPFKYVPSVESVNEGKATLTLERIRGKS